MKLRFGIVGGGGGFIGNVHRRGALNDDMAQLVAGCFSRKPEVNQETAERWNVAPHRVYDSYEKMAQVEGTCPEGIDFVVIATPNNSHFEIARAFLQQGIHVVSDKPMAMRIEEARALSALANARKLLFAVSYTYANYPLIRQARMMIDSGEIGDIVNVVCEYPQDWVLETMHRDESVHGAWRFNPDIIGPSLCVADIGTHLECLVAKMTGLRMERVLCVTDTIPNHLPLETNAQILIRFEQNIPGMMWASQVAIGHECSVSARIFGEKGAIEWNHDQPTVLRVTKMNQPTQLYTPERDYLYPEAKALTRLPYGHPEGFYEAFANIYRDFMQHVLERKLGQAESQHFYPNAEDGVRGLLFVDACLESQAKNNIWVSL